ncbi:MAG: sugar phosphate isomerase/epimerase [Bacteroidales bacterium]|jgi:sugar phosphate isomerase/epimerase|nr:sugar phosphate isomerase/epimerase [Bacteroidales bacterium]
MTNRRDFLKHASMMVAGGFLGSQLLSSCGGNAVKKNIGLQLYSLRDDINELGIKKVLEIVSKMGYTNLEAAGYGDGLIYGTEPVEFKKIVDGLGMKITSAHVGRAYSEDHAADMAWWSQCIETHAKAGLKYLVMPWAPLGKDSTADDVKKYGEYFTEVGLSAATSSLAFGYHNHAHEFQTIIDGQSIYDRLLESSSPDHVMFENDVYWTQAGGANPVEYLKKYPKRIKLLHIKDETVIGASGTLDFKAIFEQFYANGFKDWYVEVERYDGTPQEDVQKSYDFLNAATFVK